VLPLREKLNLGRKLGAHTGIVASSAALREELNQKLGPPDFSVVAYNSLSAILSREFPRDERYLFVIEAAETASLLTAQIAQLKQQYPISRIVLLGQDWTPAEISAAFKAGANAYFCDTAVSAELLEAIKCRSHDELGRPACYCSPPLTSPSAIP
jgi:DNA-binding NarL/FixJ family response regulator